MSDFLSREADILGDEFSTSLHRPTGGDDIDFDRAASAFPDIDIDGDFIQSSQPPPPIVAARTSNGFSFDNFGSPPPSQKTEVKVTGDDDFDTFESDFPEIEIDANQVSIGFASTRYFTEQEPSSIGLNRSNHPSTEIHSLLNHIRLCFLRLPS